MNKSQLQSIIKEELNKILNEGNGPTEFDFEPKSLAKGNISVEEDGDYIYGRRVGSNYTYFLKSNPKWARLKVARFSEHNGPNNYRLWLSLSAMPDDPNYKANVKKLAHAICNNLEWAGGESSNTGKIVNDFSAYKLSADEAKNAIRKFSTLLNKK